MPIFTAWGQDGQAHTLHAGVEQLRLSGGALMPDCPELIWTIDAETWEEAMAKYHELQGWEPYRPMDADDPSGLQARKPRGKKE